MRGIGVAVLLLGFAGCETTAPPMTTALSGPLSRDEARLWREAAAEEARLEASGFVVSLPETEAYLNQVLARLVAHEDVPVGQLRARVITDPALNAFAMPNGTIYLHTGLLGRLKNEAQLATILAHELTHVVDRHGVLQYRHFRTNTALASALSAGAGGYGSLLGAFGAAAAITGYSRNLERDADVQGYQRVLAAGYDVHAGQLVFDVLIEESIRSDLKEPFFFGSHPKLKERIANSFEFLQASPPTASSTRIGERDYENTLPPVLRLDAAAAMRIGDFTGADSTLLRLELIAPDDAEGAFLRGEWYRKHDTAPDLNQAVESYRRATLRNPMFGPAWRGLGITLGGIGRESEGARALQRYLRLAPTASDYAHIAQLVTSWSR